MRGISPIRCCNPKETDGANWDKGRQFNKRTVYQAVGRGPEPHGSAHCGSPGLVRAGEEAVVPLGVRGEGGRG